MNVPEFVGSVILFLVGLFAAYIFLCVLWGILLLAVGKLGQYVHWKWVPLRALLRADGTGGRQVQLVYLLPFGKWYGLALIRQTKKVIDHSRPGGREHTSPNKQEESHDL